MAMTTMSQRFPLLPARARKTQQKSGRGSHVCEASAAQAQALAGGRRASRCRGRRRARRERPRWGTTRRQQTLHQAQRRRTTATRKSLVPMRRHSLLLPFCSSRLSTRQQASRLSRRVFARLGSGIAGTAARCFDDCCLRCLQSCQRLAHRPPRPPCVVGGDPPLPPQPTTLLSMSPPRSSTSSRRTSERWRPPARSPRRTAASTHRAGTQRAR